MARLVLFTKQRADLPLTCVHDDGKVYEPGCGIAERFEAIRRTRRLDAGRWHARRCGRLAICAPTRRVDGGGLHNVNENPR